MATEEGSSEDISVGVPSDNSWKPSQEDPVVVNIKNINKDTLFLVSVSSIMSLFT
jgi:hypothetical protein